MTKDRLYTTKQVADAIGVSESSLKRWCDQGLVTTCRTGGGHRRIPQDAVVAFLRTSGHELVRPDILQLPTLTQRGTLRCEELRPAFLDAIVAADRGKCREIIVSLYLSGESVPAICDDLITPTMYRIGELWECGDVEVFQERRGCEMCEEVIGDLVKMIPSPSSTAPLAIGATPEGDYYRIATKVVEATLKSAGFRAINLGSSLPFNTLVASIEMLRPTLFWLSASIIADSEKFIAEYQVFQQQTSGMVAIAVGGQALSAPIRTRIVYATFGETMRHLDNYAQTFLAVHQRRDEVANPVGATTPTGDFSLPQASNSSVSSPS